jgi:hypothetical protein
VGGANSPAGGGAGGDQSSGPRLEQDPFAAATRSHNFGRFAASQTPVGETRPGRVMQFALRYRF